MLIIWLYSIEPSFYDELNKASLSMNLSLLDQLGPFAKAMSCILTWTELNREDRINPGINVHNPISKLYDPLGTFCKSFLLYRGASLKDEWID